MKNTINSILLTIVFCIAIHTTTQVKAQAVEQGNFLVDGFYGFPNFVNMLIRNQADSLGITSYRLKGIGPVGGRFEYMLSDRIGLGIDMSYGHTKVYQKLALLYFEENINRYRILPRLNIHFVSNNKLDFYSAIGVGVVKYKYIARTNAPFINQSDLNASIPIMPLTVRLAVGIRYFFTDKIGMNLEFGQLGPLATFGVSTKF